MKVFKVTPRRAPTKEKLQQLMLAILMTEAKVTRVLRNGRESDWNNLKVRQYITFQLGIELEENKVEDFERIAGFRLQMENRLQLAEE